MTEPTPTEETDHAVVSSEPTRHGGVRLVWHVVSGCLLGFVASPFSMLLLESIAYAPPEYVPYPVVPLIEVLSLLDLAVMLAMIPIMLGCVLATFYGAYQRQWRFVAFALPALGIFSLGMVAVLPLALGAKVQEAALRRTIERGTPLVAAIEAFNTKTGHYPLLLEELVPEYLPAIPLSGIALSRDFRYKVRVLEIGRHGFDLSVGMGIPTGSDQIYYWPDDFGGQRNPEDNKRYGDWYFFST